MCACMVFFFFFLWTNIMVLISFLLPHLCCVLIINNLVIINYKSHIVFLFILVVLISPRMSIKCIAFHFIAALFVFVLSSYIFFSLMLRSFVLAGSHPQLWFTRNNLNLSEYCTSMSFERHIALIRQKFHLLCNAILFYATEYELCAWFCFSLSVGVSVSVYVLVLCCSMCRKYISFVRW